ncbi:MAG TPA: hypothetical protein VGB68_11895 [Pyrinomonadaceae bacterium]|jgi:hypothetical protein
MQNKTGWRWNPGDLIGALEACRMLGYKSARQLQDATRRKNIEKEFESVGCTLTLGIWIGGQQRFLRSEIDEFLTKKTEAVQKQDDSRKRNLSLVA